MTEQDRVKKLLTDHLRLYGNEAVFYAGDRKILAEEMLTEIENETEIGSAFLDNIYAAAFQVLGIRQRKEFETLVINQTHVSGKGTIGVKIG